MLRPQRVVNQREFFADTWHPLRRTAPIPHPARRRARRFPARNPRRPSALRSPLRSRALWRARSRRRCVRFLPEPRRRENRRVSGFQTGRPRGWRRFRQSCRDWSSRRAVSTHDESNHRTATIPSCDVGDRREVWPRAVTRRSTARVEGRRFAGWLTAQGMTYGPAERRDASELRACNVFTRRISSCVVRRSLSRASPFRRA